MELKLSNGDYVPDGAGGFVRCAGAEGVLQRALFLLTCRRGAFALLPDVGSRLYTLAGEKKSARAALARQYCAEALSSLPVTVADVTVTDGEGGVCRIAVTLNNQESTYELEVDV